MVCGAGRGQLQQVQARSVRTPPASRPFSPGARLHRPAPSPRVKRPAACGPQRLWRDRNTGAPRCILSCPLLKFQRPPVAEPGVRPTSHWPRKLGCRESRACAAKTAAEGREGSAASPPGRAPCAPIRARGGVAPYADARQLRPGPGLGQSERPSRPARLRRPREARLIWRARLPPARPPGVQRPSARRPEGWQAPHSPPGGAGDQPAAAAAAE